MGVTTLQELFPSVWGVLEARRKEIEECGFGGHVRIYQEEKEKQLWPIARVAQQMGVSKSTARRLMHEYNARFIIECNKHWFLKTDVDRISLIKQHKQKDKHNG